MNGRFSFGDAALLLNPLGAMRRWRRIWADTDSLLCMSDRDLADIGLRRSEIGLVAHQADDLDHIAFAERRLSFEVSEPHLHTATIVPMCDTPENDLSRRRA